MGRPSKLTERQWEEIGRRLLAGEAARALGREFGISHVAIVQRFSDRIANVKAAATAILQSEAALGNLPLTDQIIARQLADDMKAMSMHLAGAGKLHSLNALNLAVAAHEQVKQIVPGRPMNSENGLDGKLVVGNGEAVRAAIVYTEASNKAADLPMRLLTANRNRSGGGSGYDGEEPPAPPPPVASADAIPNDAIEASRTYQRLINGS